MSGCRIGGGRKHGVTTKQICQGVGLVVGGGAKTWCNNQTNMSGYRIGSLDAVMFDDMDDSLLGVKAPGSF